MLKVNDKVKVHMYNTCNREIRTRNYGTVFTVKEVNGKLGIDWNTEKSPTTCDCEVFTPFETFSCSVIFENVENGKKYHWSNAEKGGILMLVDNSKYKKNHDSVIEFVKTQIGIDLNNYRDGDGSSPYTTTYWDKNGIKLCINWCGSSGGMDRNTQYAISDLVNKSNGKLALEWGGAWFKYIYFTDDIQKRNYTKRNRYSN